MKHILLMLPLVFTLVCGQAVQDEYLLCDYYKGSDWRFKHTQDELVDLVTGISFKFIKEDESGYRYFEKRRYSEDGSDNGFTKYKYHPAFRDIEQKIKIGIYGDEADLVISGQCRKAN